MEQFYHAFIKAIIILYPILLGCGMVFFYKKNTTTIQLFYFRMVQFQSARKLYTLIFFIMLLIYNYCCFDTYSDIYGVGMAAVLSMPLLVYRMANYVLQLLADYADVMLSMLVLLLILGIIIEQHVIVVTGFTYLVAAMFYPSSYLMKKIENGTIESDDTDIPSFLFRHYYENPDLFLVRYMKHLAQNNHIKKENNDKKE